MPIQQVHQDSQDILPLFGKEECKEDFTQVYGHITYVIAQEMAFPNQRNLYSPELARLTHQRWSETGLES